MTFSPISQYADSLFRRYERAVAEHCASIAETCSAEAAEAIRRQYGTEDDE
jgi:hypothetical protein